MPKGMEGMQFKMVIVNERLVALDAVDPMDGSLLGIRIEGAQVASPGLVTNIIKHERDDYRKRLHEQSVHASVPRDSLGVPGSIYQTNQDIPLVNGAPERDNQ